MEQTEDSAVEGPKRYGAFLGVFTPTVLTILGVIMYLRLGWVVGNAGLIGALVIIAISNAITAITAMSASSLASNMRVGVGGAYFLISRSFGVEVGGAIGIPLYLSQVLSVTLYAYGLAESFRVLWPGLPVPIVAAFIVVGVTAVAARSTELTLKLQLPIMGLIALSLLSLVLGISWRGPQVDMGGPWTDAGFWEVFAVFFPAVTGILTGISLSGDLKDPATAIPNGGMAAVAVGAVVYLFLPFALANGASAADLRADPLIWTEISVFSPVVMLGMWGAVLSSAFGSVLSAPRTLQALATDGLVPRRFGDLDEATGEPLFGLYTSAALALVACVLGDLNAVASWVTVFFLTTYGALNAVACLEALIGDPSFRPRIRVVWWVSFLGFAGCFIAMLSINPFACVVAVVVELGIFYGLSLRTMTSTWGDARSGLLLSGARFALLKLRLARYDPRNWRPHILVFATDLTRSLPVVRLADNFGQHRGIVTLAHLLVGDVEQQAQADAIREQSERILRQEGISCFTEVDIVHDHDRGALTVAQANGIAGLDSNTVMFAWHQAEEDVAKLARLMTLVRQLAHLQKCTLIHKPGPVIEMPGHQRRILVWWAGRENNGDLMLLLAHLLTRAHDWRGARILLKSIVDDDAQKRERLRELSQMIPEVRIDVDVDMVVRGGDDDVHRMIQEHSAGAQLVMLGMAISAPGDETAYAERMAGLLEGLPSALLVRNAGRFRGRLV